MRWNLILMFCLNGILNLKAQFNVSSNFHQRVIQKYTPNGELYMKNKLKPFSIDYNLNAAYTVTAKKKNNFAFGLTYKRLVFQVDQVIKSIEFRIFDLSDNVIDTQFVSTVMNYRSESNSLGFSFDYSYNLISKTKSKGLLGVTSNIYFFENSRDDYFGGNDTYPDFPLGSYPIGGKFNVPDNSYLGRRNNFFLSSINFSTYYKHVWQLHDNFSLAARVSIGTNLYSEWDQFRKYVWMGVGLELGFGKPRSVGARKKSEGIMG